MKPLNLNGLKIDYDATDVNKVNVGVRHELAEPFLRGPIPLAWLESAAQLGGKSLNVGLSLWFLAGVTGSRTVRFNQNRQERFGVKRDAARRAIRRLEVAGLISVARGDGRCLVVTLNHVNKISNQTTNPKQGVCHE